MRRIIGLDWLAPVVACLAFITCGKVTYDIQVTEQQIAKQLEKRFPITKTYLLVFDLTLRNPKVVLKENSDNVTIQLEALVNITGQDQAKLLGGDVTVTSRVDFDKKTGELYLTESVVDSLHLGGIPDQQYTKTKQVLGLALKEYLDNFPVYTLKARDVKTAFAKLFVKNVTVKQGVLVVTLGV